MFSLLETCLVLNSPRTGMLLVRHPRSRSYQPDLLTCPCLPGEQRSRWKVWAPCHLSRVGRTAHANPLGTDARETIIAMVRGLLPPDENSFQIGAMRSHATETTLSCSSQILPERPWVPTELGGEKILTLLVGPELAH